MCLNVCLFVRAWFSSHSRIFHSYGDVTIADERLQISTYARHSWPLSSEGSLTCHTCCDTGHSFEMVIFDVSRDTRIYCREFSSGAVTTCLYDLDLSRVRFEHPSFPLRDGRSDPLPHRTAVL